MLCSSFCAMINTTNRTELAEQDNMETVINRIMFYSALIMLTCCLLGLYGNSVSIIIFSHSSMRAPINVILTALSIIDIALIIFSIPVFILPSLNSLIQNEFIHQMYRFVSLYGYPVSMMFHTCSIWTFVLISIERYIAICTPFKRDRMLTCRRARITQTILVMSAMTYNVPRFWEYANDPETNFVQAYMRENNFYFIIYYVTLYTVTHFIGPFTAISILNIFVVFTLKWMEKNTLRRVTGNDRQQHKTTRMIILITFMFACFTTPPFVISVIEVFYPELFVGPYAIYAYIAMDISNILVVANSSFTFLIYIRYCRKYRELFLYYMTKCVCFKKAILILGWREENLPRTGRRSAGSGDSAGNSPPVVIRRKVTSSV